MKLNKKHKSEEGFAIALSVLLLVIMSLMGASLVVITSNDHKQNSKRDVYQQTFYAAETGISLAKQMLITHVASKGLPSNPKLNAIPTNNNDCPATLFSSLDRLTVYYHPIQNMNAVYYHKNTLDNEINAKSNGQTNDESKRLAKYRYYFFVTYAPDQNKKTNNAKMITVSSSSGTGSTAAVGTSYKNQGLAQAYYYNIFACGIGEDNTVVALDSIVYFTK